MLGDLLGHAVQRVEQEMRIELQAQLLELETQGLGLGAHRMPMLGLLGHLGVDPEIAEAPAGQRQRVVDPRHHHGLDRPPVRDLPAEGLAKDEDDGDGDGRGAGRQRADQRDGVRGQPIVEGARRVDRTHAGREHHQAGRDQQA